MNKAEPEGNTFIPDPAQKKYWFLVWIAVFLPLVGTGGVIMIFSLLGGVGYLVPIVGLFLFILYWLGLFHRSLEYAITDEHVVVKRGVWWQKKTTVPFEKITNVDITQNPLERIYGIGKVHTQTAGAGGSQGQKAEAVIRGIKDLSRIHDDIESRMRGRMDRRAQSPSKQEDIFDKILSELQAIRQGLEKKS